METNTETLKEETFLFKNSPYTVEKLEGRGGSFLVKKPVYRLRIANADAIYPNTVQSNATNTITKIKLIANQPKP